MNYFFISLTKSLSLLLLFSFFVCFLSLSIEIHAKIPINPYLVAILLRFFARRLPIINYRKFVPKKYLHATTKQFTKYLFFSSFSLKHFLGRLKAPTSIGICKQKKIAKINVFRIFDISSITLLNRHRIQ